MSLVKMWKPCLTLQYIISQWYQEKEELKKVRKLPATTFMQSMGYNSHLLNLLLHLQPFYYLATQILWLLLFSDPRNFKGSSLIDQNDLRCLNGNGKTDDENFLFNFIIDEYLLLQKASEANGLKRKVLLWEQFERGSLSMLARLFQKMERLKIKT